MKKIYVVKGSHDGIIGVFSNKKKAFEACKKYVIDNEEGLAVIPLVKGNGAKSEIVYKEATYSLFTKQSYPEIVNTYYSSTRASCEMFFLNEV